MLLVQTRTDRATLGKAMARHRTYLETIRGWRARISREPTISNELAAEEGSNGGQD